MGEVEARELYLFISSDGDLYRQQGLPIIKNLVQKIDRGVYNRDLAVKLYMYYMENGAKAYVRQFGGTWNTMFDKPSRELAAKNFVADFEGEYKLGNYDNFHAKKYQKKAGVLSNPAKKTICPECKGTGRDAEKTKKAYKEGRVDPPAYVRCWNCQGNGWDPTAAYRFGKNPADAYHVNDMYSAMVKAGVKIEHHESDMYVPVNDTTTEILKGYRFKKNVKVFYSGAKPWYDIPFAYVPFWEKQKQKAEKVTGIKGNPPYGYGTHGNPMNGYIAFYKGKQIEVYAESSYAAQKKAAEQFKAKKSYEVTVMLAEKDGKQVTHIPNPAASALYHSVGGNANRFKASIRTHKGDMFADGGFKTKAAAKKWLSGYYSRGLLFGRSAFIVDTNTDTIIFEKHY